MAEGIDGLRFNLDARMGPGDIVEMAFLAVQASGEEPFAAREAISNISVGTDIHVVPQHFDVLRHYATDRASRTYARGPSGSVLVEVYPGEVRITASSTTPAGAKDTVDAVASRLRRPAAPNTVPMRMWSNAAFGRQERVKLVECDEWRGVRHNYPHATRGALDALMALVRPTSRGRLILWHGEPGTGKTTALRSLAREWRPWADTSCVVDPERFFANPDYITEVIARDGDDHSDGDRWRIVVAEDADDYLRPESRQTSGGALGRLLNLTDGVLGQGSNAIVLLTTNEPLSLIDPALTRPGRSLATVNFERFSAEEAREWLPQGARGPSGSTTLAELFAYGGEYL